VTDTTDRPGQTASRPSAPAADRGEATPPGWPFFAPSAGDSVARALVLAGLRPGEHLVDLGCGDGQVLVAAARTGARVTGVECDPELAAEATEALREAGVPADRGRVVVADLFDPAVLGAGAAATADVLFAYLSPATLQRLWPRLRDRRGDRLVTIDFAVPDVRADAVDGDVHDDRGTAYLYRLPGHPRRPRPGQVGWGHPGSLCVQPPQVSSLTSLDLVHPGGPVALRVDAPLAAVASVAQGCDEAERGRTVVVDLRWAPQDEGVVAQGLVTVEGAGAHQVTVVFGEDDQGQWDLSDEGCATVTARLGQRHAVGPPTAGELLDLLDVER
jgi:SAM-dependent methyltransferase